MAEGGNPPRSGDEPSGRGGSTPAEAAPSGRPEAPGIRSEDIEDAPLEVGSDPLGDQAIEQRAPGTSRLQIGFFAVLTLLFAVFLVHDLAQHAWGRAALGAVVIAICLFAIARERHVSSSNTTRPPSAER